MARLKVTMGLLELLRPWGLLDIVVWAFLNSSGLCSTHACLRQRWLIELPISVQRLRAAVATYGEIVNKSTPYVHVCTYVRIYKMFAFVLRL